MKKGIAFFDFDGTITTRDTLLEFIRYCRGLPRLLFGFMLNSPWLVSYKLKVISNQAAKEKVLSHFFKGTSAMVFNQQCHEFATHIIPRLIRPQAMDEIKKLQAEGWTVVIVSASPENWVSIWAENNGLKFLGTKLEIKDGIVTGRIIGKNCHGEEKVRRIRECYNVADYSVISAYGDTGGDKPMLKLAGNSYYKPFR